MSEIKNTKPEDDNYSIIDEDAFINENTDINTTAATKNNAGETGGTDFNNNTENNTNNIAEEPLSINNI